MAAPCRPGPTILEPIEARGLSLRHLHHAFGILGRMGMADLADGWDGNVLVRKFKSYLQNHDL